MSKYILTIGTGTITTENFQYTIFLNEVNEAEIKISGSDSVARAAITLGATIQITRDGTLTYKGLIDNLDYLEGGGIVIKSLGFESWLAKENGSYSNSPWQNTASATIASDLIGDSSEFTTGTIEAGTNTDFRASKSDSIYNNLLNLTRKTGQDVGIDYTNTEVDVLDHLGSSTSVATLNQGLQIDNIRYSQALPLGNKIIVYGKGDGDEQITATDSDAASIAAYGEITRIIIDRSLMSNSEATTLAAAELAITKDPTKIYDFTVLNPDTSVSIGDHLLINSPDQDLNNEEVRTVAITRGLKNNQEFLELQVTNAAYKQSIKRRNKIIGGIQKSHRDNTTYMQGSGNLSQWGNTGNANNSVSMNIEFPVDSSHFEDEAGNIRVDSMTVDYDVDPYKQESGDPTIDNNNEYSIVDDSAYESAVTAFNYNDGWTTVSNSQFDNIGEHGQYIVFYIDVNAYDYDDLDDNFKISARVYCPDTGDYFPRTNGARVLAGQIHYYTDSDTHNHDVDSHWHPTNEGDAFVETDDCSDLAPRYCWTGTGDSSPGTDNDAHTHLVDAIECNGCITIVCPIDPNGKDFDIQIKRENSDNPTTDILALIGITYNVDGRHDHNATIGDDVSEAGSLKATQVSIYLDYWNGSTWVNKHSILNTGKTIDTDVDITDSGTYPDATGLWRTRIITDNASPDFVNGIVKIRHQLDAA